jgi:hypothetical protein
MKQTQKYRKACEQLSYPHSNQEELYCELNRLGWFWNSKNKEWLRDDRPPQPASASIKVRVWAASDKVELAAEHFVESAGEMGLRLVEQSEPYPCRPPQQNDSRIYLTFVED